MDKIFGDIRRWCFQTIPTMCARAALSKIGETWKLRFPISGNNTLHTCSKKAVIHVFKSHVFASQSTTYARMYE
eukprot:1329668-Amorphochlora_amoeboformis.AAC.1